MQIPLPTFFENLSTLALIKLFKKYVYTVLYIQLGHSFIQNMKFYFDKCSIELKI